jgi:cobalamin biosynthesis protein CobT
MPVFDPRELAMQIVDVIYLRPEIELCYVGISNKCFEILEHRASSPDIHESQQSDTPTAATLSGDEDADEEDSDSDLDDDDDEDEDDMDEPSSEDENVEEEHIIATETLEAEGHDFGHSDESDHFDGETDDGSEMDSNRLSWTLREILFYDDKISIFKARHMRL